METIDLTPTWEEILSTWLFLYREAVIGRCDNPAAVIENAEKEFLRMAQAADRWNARPIVRLISITDVRVGMITLERGGRAKVLESRSHPRGWQYVSEYIEGPDTGVEVSRAAVNENTLWIEESAS